jgi:hypothetical protein
MDKRSSLYLLTLSDEEEKSFITLIPGAGSAGAVIPRDHQHFKPKVSGLNRFWAH